MENQEALYQRLIELGLIMEGCLRTMYARESKDVRIMFADCLAEYNNLAAELMYQEEPSYESQPDPEVAPEPAPAPAPESEPEPVPEPKSNVENEAISENTPQQDDGTDLRLDEVLSRREARQLRKVFTLNDKFRFRRELFNGDDEAFGRTLDMLQAMNGMDEATRYMYDDLGWDPENEHVADFVLIVKNHFS